MDEKGNKVGGHHIVMLDGSSEPLIDEEWTRDSFPIVSVSWDRAMRGCFGTSCMDETDGWEIAGNELLSRMLDTARRTSMNILMRHIQTDVKDCDVTKDAAVALAFQSCFLCIPGLLKVRNGRGFL